MAEGNADLVTLIQQRNKRPTYARMISWEFSSVREPLQRRKSRHRKKHASGPEEGIESREDAVVTGCEKMVEVEVDNELKGSGSESSEYETACEDEVDILELSLSQSGSFKTGTSIDITDREDGVEDEEERESSNSHSDNNVFEDIITDVPARHKSADTTADDQRRKKLTKRQKRRKKNEFKLIHANDFLAMGQLCDMENEIEAILLEIGESQTSVDVDKPVPSLVELCLRASQRKTRTRSKSSTSEVLSPYRALPPGIKPILRTFGSHFKMHQLQLKVLQNHILPMHCTKQFIEDERSHWNKEFIDNKPIILPIRSVWAHLSYPPVSEANVQYPSSRKSAYLMDLTYHWDPDWADKYLTGNHWGYNSYYDTYLKKLPLVLPTFASTIDLMLPGVVWQPQQAAPHMSKEETMSRQIQTMTVRVKNALNLRFPHMTDLLFERLLPYVMWARGQVAMAAEMFRSLIAKEPCNQYKAMYLAEIARMHAQFGDTSSACKLYRLAGEKALEEVSPLSSDDTIRDVTEQTQILLANVFDVGVITDEKAQQSCSHWSSARNLEGSKEATVLASLDSFLCYHAAHWKGNWLEDALTRIKNKLRDVPALHYLAAMLQAIQGHISESHAMYKGGRNSHFQEYLNSAAQCLPKESKIKNPFWPILHLVEKQKGPLPLLKVIWRSQLNQPCVQHTRLMEGQVNKKKLHLRQDENGCITGDLEMLLPPLRNISLNPYTGALVLNQVPSNTGVWKNLCLKNTSYHSMRLLPSPVILLEDEDGTSVHMVVPGITEKGSVPGSIMLYWRGPDRDAAKLNLYTELKNYIKHHVVQLIEQKKSSMTEGEYDACLQLVTLHYNKNAQMRFQDIQSAAKHMVSDGLTKQKHNSKEPKKKDLKKEQKKKKHPIVTAPYLRFEFHSEPFVFGKTIVLNVVCTKEISLLVFINTSSRETFLQPSIHWKSEMEEIRHQGFKHRSDAEFYLAFHKSSLRLFNQFGTLTDLDSTKHLDRYEMVDKTFHPVVIGSTVFGLNKTRTSVWSLLVGVDFDPSVPKDDPSTIFDAISTWEIAPYWDQLAEQDDARVIHNLVAIGNQVKGHGHLLMVVMSVGLGFMDPGSLTFVPVELAENVSQLLTTDGKVLCGRFETCKLLEQKCFQRDGQSIYMAALSVQNRLIVLETSHCPDNLDDKVKVKLVSVLTLPGAAMDMCFVGHNHILISVSHTVKESLYHREHLYFFTLDGFCKGVLLSLGPGPRSFFPLYLHGNDEGQSTGWHVYMRDGHHGIICVQMPC